MAEKTITTVLCPGGRVRMERLLRLIRKGCVDPSPLTTHVFPFAKMDEAFELMRTKRDGIIKPLVQFEEARLPQGIPQATQAGAKSFMMDTTIPSGYERATAK